MIGPGANVGVDGISPPSNRPAPEDKPSLSSRIGATCEHRKCPAADVLFARILEVRKRCSFPCYSAFPAYRNAGVLLWLRSRQLHSADLVAGWSLRGQSCGG